MSKITQGPWTVIRNHPQNACAYVVDGDRREVCTLYGGSEADKDENGVWGPHPIRDANAKAISALPDLIEALQVAESAVQELCNDQHPDNQCWVTLATVRAALTKAGVL